MLTIGLTGGIASGKTMISNLFSKLGVPIVDTDLISRDLLEIGQPGYQKVIEHFGDEILQQDRQIDRRILRRRVFDDAVQKSWLEAVLHPMIYQRTQLDIECCKAENYVLVVIPLLFETRFQDLVNRILAIDCPPPVQIERLLARDGIELKLARQILASQWSNEARLEHADDIIQNESESLASLTSMVERLHQKYLLLAA